MEVVANGTEALAAWKARRPDLVVLDIMLPGIDGLGVLEHIRLEDRRLPVLILSARGGSDDRVKGLARGADDYLAKPFNLDEFLLRVQRLMARAEWSRQAAAEADAAPEAFSFGANRIDFVTATALCRQGRIRLTEQELRLLRLFVQYRGKPLSREKILEIGWGYSGQMTTRTVDNFIVRFRKYFEDDPRHPRYFKSLRAVGYLFEPD